MKSEILDKYYMKKVLSLAQKGIGLTKTNPRVGAVIVKNNTIISQGYHKGFGLKHAEIDAIENAGNKNLKGSTLYCNLEPCSVYYPGKKNPPCVHEIIKRKISRVVIANLDKNPNFLNHGIKKLEESGIKVDVGVLSKKAYVLNEGFFKFITQSKPFVNLKFAQTLDGKTASKSFDSKWITSEKSRRQAHKIRCFCDAVMIGKNTLLNDNPSLNIRLDNYNGQEIKKIVLLSDIKDFPPSCNLATNFADSTIIFTSDVENEYACHLKKIGLRVVRAKTKNGMIDLEDVLLKLSSFSIMKLLVEGGSSLITEFLKLNLFDKVSVFISPKILGSGLSLGDIGAKRIKDSLLLKNVSYKKIEDEILIEGYKELLF